MPKHPRLDAESLQQAILDASRCVASRRHMLEPIPAPPETRRPDFGSLFVQRCVQCGTLTFDKVSRITGERLSPRVYNKPYWYEQALEEGHDPAWWRATYWETLSPEFFLDPDREVTPIRGGRKRKVS